MEKEKKTKDENKKLTYEQLNDVCNQLYQQNQTLKKELYEANLSNMFKRLDYLFQVLKYENTIKDAEFIGNCVAEIKSAMTVPEEKNKSEEE